MDILFFIIGAVIGFLVCLYVKADKIKTLEGLNCNLEAENNEKNTKILELTQKFAETSADLKNNEEKINSQQEIFKLFKTEFENLSNSILEKNSNKLTEKNVEILAPFKEQIEKFQKSLVDESNHRASLDTLVREYQSKCIEISKEAEKLTNALKNDTKKKGMWGEFVLQKLLESSGLIENENFTLQPSFKNDLDKTVYPDVIINLPDNRHIVIDSKLPLTSFQKLSNADDVEERETHKKEFIKAVDTFVKDLNEKAYSKLNELNTPDFVLMFIPVESAFSVLHSECVEMLENAWRKKIIIVSPSTLLVALKTIDSFWKEEKQAKFAQDIANECTKLYDKFVALLDEMLRVSAQMKTAQSTHDNVLTKLQGKGNLIRQIENIKKIGGLSPKKEISKELLLETEEENTYVEN